jgi:hypothetical protein
MAANDKKGIAKWPASEAGCAFSHFHIVYSLTVVAMLNCKRL